MRYLRVSFILLLLPLIAVAASATQYKGNTDVCLNETLVLNQNGIPQFSVSKPPSYDVCVQQKCTVTKEKAKQCQCGKESFNDTTGKLSKLSLDRCDPNMQKLIARALSGQASPAEMNNFVNQAIAQQAVSQIDTTTEQGRTQLSNVLQSVGVNGATQDVVNQDPQNAYDLLQKIAAGDQAGAQAAAAKLHLNDDLSDIASLQAKLPQAVGQNLPQEDIMRAAAETGFGYNAGGVSNTVGNIQDQAAGMCLMIRGGCGNACSYQYTLVCRTNNPGAIVDSPATRKYGCVSCGASNNTACCPSMEAGVAAMSELLTGPGYFGGYNNTLFSAICKYSPVSAGNNCYAYAMRVAQEMGVSPYQTLDPLNTSQMSQVMMAMSAYEHGSGVPFSLAQLQTGLEARYGQGNLPAGDPNFATRFVAGGAPTSGYYSPFAVGYGTYNTAGQVGYPTGGYGSYNGAPVSTGSTVTTGGNVSTGSTIPTGATGRTTAPPPPVATLLLQPLTVFTNNPLSVSWSSLGMRPDAPCVVTLATSSTPVPLVQGNEGSKTIYPKSTGTWKFELRCSGQDGSTVIRDGSVTVQ